MTFIQDTARNLRLIDLCEHYAAAERDRAALKPQRAYVMMMLTRARTQTALTNDRPEAALQIVEEGIASLEALAGKTTDDDPFTSEADTLRTLRREVLDKMSDDAPAKLQAELQQALACEDYERAAELRDRLTSVPDCGYGV